MLTSKLTGFRLIACFATVIFSISLAFASASDNVRTVNLLKNSDFSQGKIILKFNELFYFTDEGIWETNGYRAHEGWRLEIGKKRDGPFLHIKKEEITNLTESGAFLRQDLDVDVNSCSKFFIEADIKVDDFKDSGFMTNAPIRFLVWQKTSDRLFIESLNIWMEGGVRHEYDPYVEVPKGTWTHAKADFSFLKERQNSKINIFDIKNGYADELDVSVANVKLLCEIAPIVPPKKCSNYGTNLVSKRCPKK